MVLKNGDGVWAGSLIDDTTGTIFPGGQKVLFSKSAGYYLAYSQDDGRDGKTLKLYRRDGKLLWEWLRRAAYSERNVPDRLLREDAVGRSGEAAGGRT